MNAGSLAQLRPRRCRHGIGLRRGFSLVEAVVAAGIVALMLVASLNLLTGAARSRAADSDRRTALMLADQLMAEIQQQPYKDESLTGLLFGPELGETGGTRAKFDDVDDYDGFAEKPLLLKDGSPLAGFEAWQRKVKVKWVQPGGLAAAVMDTGLELIEVKVIDPKGRETAVHALRSSYTTADPPPAGTTAMLWAGIELDVGTSPTRHATLGVTMLNRPPTP